MSTCLPFEMTHATEVQMFSHWSLILMNTIYIYSTLPSLLPSSTPFQTLQPLDEWKTSLNVSLPLLLLSTPNSIPRLFFQVAFSGNLANVSSCQQMRSLPKMIERRTPSSSLYEMCTQPATAISALPDSSLIPWNFLLSVVVSVTSTLCGRRRNKEKVKCKSAVYSLC